MRLEENPQFPGSPGSDFERSLLQVLTRVMRAGNQKVNQLADGRLSAIDNALTAAPTTGTWNTGDFVRNSAPVEAGGAGSKYVIVGWINTAGGTPGTFLQCRYLTGN